MDKYTGGHPHFVLSTIARGGFSGGVAIVAHLALGVVTESLVADGKEPEAGYLAVLTVAPIYNCLCEHGILPEVQRRPWIDRDDISIWDIPTDQFEQWTLDGVDHPEWRGWATQRLKRDGR